MMDNATFHKKHNIQQVIIDAGYMVEYLPTYSPDLNPIEHKWAQAKSKKQKKRDGLRYREFVLSPYGVIKIKSLGYTIARELALPRSTISRELRRNTDPTFNGVYCCSRADTLARERRHKPLPNNAFYPLEPHIQNFIRQALSTHSSPEIISGRLHLEFGISVSKNTLYRYILQERQAGGELYQQLPHRGKRYRYNAENLKSGPIPNRVGIGYRPAQAELKQEPGHFEIDTIFGKDQKSFLLTIVDKALKTFIIRKLPNKRAETVVAAFRYIEANAAGDLENATLLVFRDGCSYRDRLTVWLQQAQVKPYRLAEMSSYHAILGGVSAGMGVGIVPRPILCTFPSENLITVHPFMESGNPITTALVWRKDGMTANIRALIDILSSEAESVSDTQRSAES